MDNAARESVKREGPSKYQQLNRNRLYDYSLSRTVIRNIRQRIQLRSREGLFFSAKSEWQRDEKKTADRPTEKKNATAFLPFPPICLFLFFCFSPLRCHVGFADTNLVRNKVHYMFTCINTYQTFRHEKKITFVHVVWYSFT